MAELIRKASKDERRQRTMDRHFKLVEDLAGPGGVVVRQIAAKLARRIDQLIGEDPEARAYLALLKEIQGDLLVGERVIADTVTSIMESV